MTTATQPQNIVALNLANAIRLPQAARRHEIAALSPPEARRAVASILRDLPDEYAERERLGRLLGAIKRLGPRRMERLLGDLGMSRGRLNRRLSELSVRERETLAQGLTFAGQTSMRGAA